MGVAELQERHGLQVIWTPFPLHPEVPDGGLDLTDLFGPRTDIDGMMVRLKGVAEDLGLPLGDRTRTFNSRRAQELGVWADGQGLGDPWRTVAYQAYFAHGRNLAEPEVLLDLCRSVGLDPDRAEKHLDTRSLGPSVDAAWARARQLGVQAVPTHFMAGQMTEGFHPADRLEAWIRPQLRGPGRR